jgi:hypothetical protein
LSKRIINSVVKRIWKVVHAASAKHTAAAAAAAAKQPSAGQRGKVKITTCHLHTKDMSTVSGA